MMMMSYDDDECVVDDVDDGDFTSIIIKGIYLCMPLLCLRLSKILKSSTCCLNSYKVNSSAA